ncbi:SPOR domain-containing protein [Pseudoxanthomonas suwonensis]|uniref:Sporulation protein n=1 Tax=Pseudoxanthomonas suwonensis TaxID=314722 RepID=A0A0E3YZD2_9GAMM|nr:SPOR domain-containing protein [Pseudoxanthomonas suwonensis]AKC85957.1 sporulation protein [Pseudoxanthomonas suwonensis]
MDTQLKQRLIGGAVLVALAVIFLPMLVQGPAPDSGVGNVSTRVPDAPGGGYETRELPLLGPAAAPATGAAALPAPATTATPDDGAATEAGPAPARPDPAVAAGQWAVSFGAYASARDADAVLSRLRQAGLQGFSEQDTINGRQAWRVRVGPYADRALAEAGRLQAVRIRNDVNAQVIALDAGAGAPATGPAAQATAPVAPAATGASQATAATAAAPTRTETLPAETPASPPAAPPKATPAPATDTAARPAAAAASPPPPPAAPAASSVGFAVQMGAFANAADANALRDRLRAAGFSAIVQPVSTDKGTLNRVRVGPVSTRAEAEQLKARLASGFGAGMVVPHP